MTPVSLGVLRSALPIDVTNLPLGNYSFGVLLGYTADAQIYDFTPIASSVWTNPIEYQNSVAERCTALREMITQGKIQTLQTNKKDCSKTIFYSVCVYPQEQAKIQNNNNATLIGLGPDPTRCQRIQIKRKMPTTAFLLAHVSKSLQSSNGMIALESPSTATIYIQSTRYPTPAVWTNPGTFNRVEAEYITLPSQQTHLITLKSKSSSQNFVPYKNFVRGGLEDPEDINRILNNEGFSLELDVNNITPNVRELFADETEQSYSNNTIIGGQAGDGTPVVMNFQGYSVDSKPKYEFDTFQTFHNKIKSYYDYKAASLLQPNVSYSADLFCSSISDDLKSLLSVDNGLVKLGIALAENGLTIQCGFQSNPAKPLNFQSLIYKTRPNIKLVNTNFLS